MTYAGRQILPCSLIALNTSLAIVRNNVSKMLSSSVSPSPFKSYRTPFVERDASADEVQFAAEDHALALVRRQLADRPGDGINLRDALPVLRTSLRSAALQVHRPDQNLAEWPFRCPDLRGDEPQVA